MSRAVLCVDFGSTFTKACAVEVGTGKLLATASASTTVSTDVMVGYAAVRSSVLSQQPGVSLDRVLACSSAGGGLRIAVVGYERLVTSEAGHRVALSAGGKVVHVAAGAIDDADLAQLEVSTPDLVLLVGGTDGGNSMVLLHNASALGSALAVSVPVVVAGNVAVRDEVCALLSSDGRLVVPTANVLPAIGVLDARHARTAIREVFLRHVIGGKRLSRGDEFARMVRAATPDAVLTGVELLADGSGAVPGVGDVLVVDVGGATTDVYSVVTPDEETAARRHDVVEVLWRARTVEGDLGMRWNAPGIVAAARAEGLLGEDSTLDEPAFARSRDVGMLPATELERDDDARLAGLAVTVALRRHGRGGRELRHVRRVVGSGGALRHATPDRVEAILAPATSDFGGGWQVPDRAATIVDVSYVLAAAGLLAGAGDPGTAARLLHAHLA